MQRIQMEPIVIRPHRHRRHADHAQHAVHTQHAVSPTASRSVRPTNVETLVQHIQREFPTAHIRITGRGRTPRRQAELMADRRRANRAQFLHTYAHAQHITEMDQWVATHPRATVEQTYAAFEEIIVAARRRGATVSNHLSDRARDISIPAGGAAIQQQVRSRLHALGAHVLDEHDAVGGAHWHVDY